MLEDEFQFFKENQQKLFAEYPNKYLVIKDKTVILDANTFEEALCNAENQGIELGTFLIQLCSKDNESYTQTYHSRVIFA